MTLSSNLPLADAFAVVVPLLAQGRNVALVDMIAERLTDDAIEQPPTG